MSGSTTSPTPVDTSGMAQALEEAAVYYEQTAKEFREVVAQLKPVDRAKAKASVEAALKSAQAGADKMRRARQIAEDLAAMQPPEEAEAAHKAAAKHA